MVESQSELDTFSMQHHFFLVERLTNKVQLFILEYWAFFKNEHSETGTSKETSDSICCQ